MRRWDVVRVPHGSSGSRCPPAGHRTSTRMEGGRTSRVAAGGCREPARGRFHTRPIVRGEARTHLRGEAHPYRSGEEGPASIRRGACASASVSTGMEGGLVYSSWASRPTSGRGSAVSWPTGMGFGIRPPPSNEVGILPAKPRPSSSGARPPLARGSDPVLRRCPLQRHAVACARTYMGWRVPRQLVLPWGASPLAWKGTFGGRSTRPHLRGEEPGVFFGGCLPARPGWERVLGAPGRIDPLQRKVHPH